ncbi:MAG: hypothetical protein H0U03_01145 [Actinobacteria bacterium]|nr:hypothetical protein [Actinomycetota bacterium]
MTSVSEERGPQGPLAVRWGPLALGGQRAGAITEARVTLSNAGLVTWRSNGPTWIYLSYHWLDDRGNPIVWDGLRAPLGRPVAPGETIEVNLPVRAPIPPGRYRLAFDLLDAERLWFSELGNPMLEVDAPVEPRIAERRLSVMIRPGAPELVSATEAALTRQEDVVATGGEATAFLAAGCLPAPDWSARVLDAHTEGYVVVAGSIEAVGRSLVRRRSAGSLAPWAPGGGRNPAFSHPLLCPSVLASFEPAWVDDVEGLPALAPPDDEPWLYDGRIALRTRARPLSGRRRV